MTYATDFNAQTDGDDIGLIAGWTKHLGRHRVIVAGGNRVGGVNDDSGSGPGIACCPDQGATDNYVQMRLVQLVANRIGPVSHAVDNQHWVGVMLVGTGSQGLRLVKRVGSTLTFLANTQGVAGAVYRIEVVVNGANLELTLLEDGVAVPGMFATVPVAEISGSDTNIGIANETESDGSTVGYWDDFEAGALSAAGSVDSDHATPIAHTAVAEVSGVMPVGSSQTSLADRSSSISNFQGVDADQPALLANARQVDRESKQPTGISAGTSAVVVQPLAWAQIVAAELSARLERLQSLQASTVVPLLSLEPVVSDADYPVAWQGGVAVTSDHSLRLSWLNYLAANFDTGAAWAGQVDRPTLLQLAHQVGVDSSIIVPIAYAQTIEVSSGVPVDWQGALVVASDVDMPLDWMVELAANKPLPLGTVTVLTSPHSAPVANRSGVVSDQNTVTAWLEQVLANHNLPAEWAGTIIVASDHVYPIAYGGVSGFISGNVNVFHLDARQTLWQLHARSVTWRITKQ